MRDDLSKVGYLEENGEGYSPCQDCPLSKDCEVEEDYDECEDCPCFNDGFDLGFKKGHQAAREELMDDIYISDQKIDKIDEIRQKVLALGHNISSEHSEQINGILEDLLNLLKDIAFEAVEEYLGYR